MFLVIKTKRGEGGKIIKQPPVLGTLHVNFDGSHQKDHPLLAWDKTLPRPERGQCLNILSLTSSHCNCLCSGNTEVSSVVCVLGLVGFHLCCVNVILVWACYLHIGVE